MCMCRERVVWRGIVMEAIVLAGGFGTRLAHIVADVPKPMAPVCERPFLRVVLDDLIAKGVTKIVLAVGYKSECITEYFGKRYRGVEIIYSLEDTPLGTGGAIKKALSICNDEKVFVFNGDTYFEVELEEMKKSNNQIVVAVKRMQNFSRYGTVSIQNGLIKEFKEKRYAEEGMINGGIYYLSRDVFDKVEQQTFSFETDVLEQLVEKGCVSAYESEGYFIDIGIPEDYEKAQTEMLEYCKESKIAFFDRDGTINVNTGHLFKKEEMVFIEGMPEFIKKWNDWGYKVVVVTNQAGIAKGYYTEKDMHELHRYMNEELAKYGAHIDAFYYCPHHPDYTGECECRKPKPGMIKQALHEFNGNASKSILFGDKIGDIDAGIACGVVSYLV